MTSAEEKPEAVSLDEVLDEFSEVIELDRGNAFAYESRPPVFANLHDLEESAEKHAQRVLYRSQALLPKAKMLRISNAKVSWYGTVTPQSGRQILETVPRGASVETADVPDDEVSDFSVLLRKYGDGNFGHWLIELCTRVLEFRKAYPSDDWKVAIPHYPLGRRDLRLRTLKWLGIGQDRVVWIKNGTTRFRDLAFITSNSVHSHSHDPKGVRFVRDAALNAVGEVGKGRRLFLGRSGAKTRELLNEAEVLEICARYGFESMRPETLSIDDQVRLFASAECIVGVSGAALTNILFAPQSCKILSLNPNQGPEYFFWDIANIVGQEFSYIFGPASDPERGVHSSFHIDAQLVARWLQDHLGAI